MTLRDMLSDVAISNLRTKSLTSKYDDRQKVERIYTVPDTFTRRLLARLILEESLETIKALGFSVKGEGNALIDSMENAVLVERPECDMLTGQPKDPRVKRDVLGLIVDGCCDLIYVATGCMVAHGVPDLPHLKEVCRANDAKFPEGKVIFDGNGKYLKPKGWTPPDHAGVSLTVGATAFDMETAANELGLIPKTDTSGDDLPFQVPEKRVNLRTEKNPGSGPQV